MGYVYIEYCRVVSKYVAGREKINHVFETSSIINRKVLYKEVVGVGKRTRSREFSMTDIADVFGVHRHTVKRWLDSGKLEGTTIDAIVKYAYQKGWVDALEEVKGWSERTKYFAPADGYRKHRKM